jgi:hypothetical protein
LGQLAALPAGGSSYSIQADIRWKDQGWYSLSDFTYLVTIICAQTNQCDGIGWGNAKGEVYFQLTRGGRVIKEYKPFPIAPHAEVHLISCILYVRCKVVVIQCNMQ